MTRHDATVPKTPSADWENEGGALATMPGHDIPAAITNAEWRALVTLGAVMAAWPDLSINVRRRITSDAIVAMRRAEMHDEPRP